MLPGSENLLRSTGLDPTPLRVAVLHFLLQSHSPLQAQEILDKVRQTRPINKVTLYRILDLLVHHGLVLRHSSGERAFRYCALPPHKRSAEDCCEGDGGQLMHCHFHCTQCGGMHCIESDAVPLNCAELLRNVPQQVQAVEIRLDGLCADCLEKSEDTKDKVSCPHDIKAD